MIKPENRNCFEFFTECTKDFGVYDVAESFGSLISRKKFIHDVESVAGYLDSKGIKRGDVVTVFLPNVAQSFVAFYAINRIGAIANIVHPLTPADALEEIVKTSRAKAIFVLDINDDDGFIDVKRYSYVSGVVDYLGSALGSNSVSGDLPDFYNETFKNQVLAGRYELAYATAYPSNSYT